eukprot:gene7377-2710_t
MVDLNSQFNRSLVLSEAQVESIASLENRIRELERALAKKVTNEEQLNKNVRELDADLAAEKQVRQDKEKEIAQFMEDMTKLRNKVSAMSKDAIRVESEHKATVGTLEQQYRAKFQDQDALLGRKNREIEQLKQRLENQERHHENTLEKHLDDMK